MKTFNDVVRLPEFEKDLKKLLKRFKTLEDDLDIFIRTELNLYHKLWKDTGGIFRLTGLAGEEPKIYKAKKFACRSLRGKGVQSGIRIIYAYWEKKDRAELIEIYYKGDKVTEDRDQLARVYRQGSGGGDNVALEVLRERQAAKGKGVCHRSQQRPCDA